MKAKPKGPKYRNLYARCSDLCSCECASEPTQDVKRAAFRVLLERVNQAERATGAKEAK